MACQELHYRTHPPDRRPAHAPPHESAGIGYRAGMGPGPSSEAGDAIIPDHGKPGSQWDSQCPGQRPSHSEWPGPDTTFNEVTRRSGIASGPPD